MRYPDWCDTDEKRAAYDDTLEGNLARFGEAVHNLSVALADMIGLRRFADWITRRIRQ